MVLTRTQYSQKIIYWQEHLGNKMGLFFLSENLTAERLVELSEEEIVLRVIRTVTDKELWF